MAKVNGIYHDGTTIETSIEGYGPLTGIQAINWGITVDSQKVKGAGQKHIGRTPGIIEVSDASMDIYLSEHDALVQTFGGSPTALLNKIFDVTVTYQVTGEPLSITRLLDCRIIEVSSAHSYTESSPLVVTYTLQVMGIDTVTPTWYTVNIPLGH